MDRVISLLEALPYIRAYGGQTFVVKVGGALLEQPAHLDGLARDVAALHRLGVGVVLVHGGGPQLDAAAAARGLESRQVAGRRVTSPELIEAASQVWRGQLSLALVGAMRRHGELAVGLSGADGGLLQAVRRPPTVMTDESGDRVTVDFGQVGDLVAIRTELLRSALASGSIPIVSPLAMSESGEVLNVNADTVAARLALALGAAKLILVTGAPGILEDPADPASALHWTDLAELAELEAAGRLTGGMRPKIAAIRAALEGGVPRAHVIDGRRPGALLEEVFTTDGCGTLVVAASEDCPSEPLS